MSFTIVLLKTRCQTVRLYTDAFLVSVQQMHRWYQYSKCLQTTATVRSNPAHSDPALQQ